MAINFPTPLVEEDRIFTDTVSGITYEWIGTLSPLSGFWMVKSAEGSGSSTPGGGSGNASIYVGPAPPTTIGPNQLWWNSSNGRMYIYYEDGDTNQWVETSPGVVTPDAIPVGAVLAYASLTIPAGFFECDGRAVSRTTYSALFAAIGTVHGAGDGTNTFNIPDYRGEFLRGYDHGRNVDNVGTFTGTKTNANATITGLSIPANLLEVGMSVVGTGIPANAVINAFSPTTGTVTSITMNVNAAGSGSVSINIFGRKFGVAQADMFESHAHALPYNSNQHGAGTGQDTGEPGSGFQANALTDVAGGAETRPRNQAVVYIIKAFAAVTNPGLIDVADLADEVIALQNPDHLHAETGYDTLPSGLIIKWGKIDSAAVSSVAVTFNTPFTEIYNVQVTGITTGTPGQDKISVKNVTINGFTAITYGSADAGDIYWQAIGK